jgi:hypothetical protein
VLANNALKNQSGALGNNGIDLQLGYATQQASTSLLLRGGFSTDRGVTIVTSTGSPLGFLRTVGGDSTSGTATIGGTVNVNTNARLTAAEGGTVVFGGNVNDGTTNFQSAATISKIGLGTVILSGSNSTTLPWAVQAGRLLVNGTNAGSGGTTVDAGALLGGSGRIDGLVTVSGTLSPGNSPGILTLSQLVLTSTATTLMEIDGLTRGSQYDGIDITTSGGLTYAGALSIAFGLGSPVADNTMFNLFSFTGTPTGDFTSVVSTGGVYAGTWSQVSSGTWSLQSGAQTLTFSTATGDVIIVPEPGTLAMLAGAGVAAAFALARRRR